MEKKKRMGRPIRDPRFKKEPIPLKLPNWMCKRIRVRKAGINGIIEPAILEFTGWKAPKEKK